MPSPVLPSQFNNVVPGPTGSVCAKLAKVLIQFPALFAQWFAWAFNADGTPSNAFTGELHTTGDYLFTHNPADRTAKGWLPCTGTAVSRTTYANLYAIVGTTFGVGDGATTFNLPDFRDKSPIGAALTYTIGSTVGAATTNVTLTTAMLPAHNHKMGVEAGGAGSVAVTSTVGFLRTGDGVDVHFASGSKTQAAVSENTGTGTAVPVAVVHPSIATYFWIKT